MIQRRDKNSYTQNGSQPNGDDLWDFPPSPGAGVCLNFMRVSHDFPNARRTHPSFKGSFAFNVCSHCYANSSRAIILMQDEPSLHLKMDVVAYHLCTAIVIFPMHLFFNDGCVRI